MIRHCILLAFLLIATDVTASSTVADETRQHPDIVFIMADDVSR